MDAFVAGAWRTAARGEAFIGNTWRRVTRAEAYIGGQWRQILSFAPPLSLSAPTPIYGSRSPSKPTPGNVVAYASAVPSGGVAPYRYHWQLMEGQVNISSPQNSATSINYALQANSEADGLLRVTCTDAMGSVAVADVMFYLSNQSIY